MPCAECEELRRSRDEARAALEKSEGARQHLVESRSRMVTRGDEERQRAERAEAAATQLKKAAIELSGWLSKVDYVLGGKPNEMELSDYDVHCDGEAVISRAAALVSAAAAMRAALEGACDSIAENDAWHDASRNEEGDVTCPQDDTCQCPLPAAVNAALATDAGCALLARVERYRTVVEAVSVLDRPENLTDTGHIREVTRRARAALKEPADG